MGSEQGLKINKKGAILICPLFKFYRKNVVLNINFSVASILFNKFPTWRHFVAH